MNSTEVLVQYGAIGIMLLILLGFAKFAIRRETDRADRLEEENRRLNNIIMDRVIPGLTSAQQATEQSVALMTSMQREREILRELGRRDDRGTP